MGMGIAFLSRAAVEAELTSGRLGELDLQDGPERRSWFVLRSAVGPVRPPVQEFVTFVLAKAGREATTT